MFSNDSMVTVLLRSNFGALASTFLSASAQSEETVLNYWAVVLFSLKCHQSLRPSQKEAISGAGRFLAGRRKYCFAFWTFESREILVVARHTIKKVRSIKVTSCTVTARWETHNIIIIVKKKASTKLKQTFANSYKFPLSTSRIFENVQFFCGSAVRKYSLFSPGKCIINFSKRLWVN